MTKITLKRTIEAEQWLGENHPLPQGAFLCRPEVCWSADRKLIYFTYADLRSRHWIDAEPRVMPAPAELDFMCGGHGMTRCDGTEYWRQSYPFNFWSVKSEASLKRDWRPVYLEREDDALVEIFLDYCFVEGWTNPLPPRAEFRIVDGAYRRGFRPVYLSPNDWLVREHGAEPRVMTDTELKALAISA